MNTRSYCLASLLSALLAAPALAQEATPWVLPTGSTLSREAVQSDLAREQRKTAPAGREAAPASGKEAPGKPAQGTSQSAPPAR